VYMQFIKNNKSYRFDQHIEKQIIEDEFESQQTAKCLKIIHWLSVEITLI